MKLFWFSIAWRNANHFISWEFRDISIFVPNVLFDVQLNKPIWIWRFFRMKKKKKKRFIVDHFNHSKCFRSHVSSGFYTNSRIMYKMFNNICFEHQIVWHTHASWSNAFNNVSMVNVPDEVDGVCLQIIWIILLSRNNVAVSSFSCFVYLYSTSIWCNHQTKQIVPIY